MTADVRYLLPSRASRDDLTRRMNAMMRDIYGSLDAQMCGVDPEARVRRLHESMGAPRTKMMGLASLLEYINT